MLGLDGTDRYHATVLHAEIQAVANETWTGGPAKPAQVPLADRRIKLVDTPEGVRGFSDRHPRQCHPHRPREGDRHPLLPATVHGHQRVRGGAGRRPYRNRLYLISRGRRPHAGDTADRPAGADGRDSRALGAALRGRGRAAHAGRVGSGRRDVRVAGQPGLRRARTSTCCGPTPTCTACASSYGRRSCCSGRASATSRMPRRRSRWARPPTARAEAAMAITTVRPRAAADLDELAVYWPRHARRPLPAPLLAAGLPRRRPAARPRQAAAHHERGLHALPRRGRRRPTSSRPAAPIAARSFSTGWVEGDCVRCFYHGWKYDGSRPVRRDARRRRRASRRRCGSRAIRREEYLGLIFAYLGEGAPPPLPRYPEFEDFDGVLEIDSLRAALQLLPEPRERARHVPRRLRPQRQRGLASRASARAKTLHAEESDWGVIYTATRANGEMRINQFGMPNIFHMNALPTDPEIGWQESLFWWVPIDDATHVQFSIHRLPITGEAADADLRAAPGAAARTHRAGAPGGLRADPGRDAAAARRRAGPHRPGAHPGRRGAGGPGAHRRPRGRAAGPQRPGRHLPAQDLAARATGAG